MHTTESDLNKPLISMPSSIPTSSMIREVGVKLVVASLFTLPFVLSSIEVVEQYPVAGPIFISFANLCIFRIAWVLYANHFIGLFDSEHELQHIACHLENDVDEIAEIHSWSVRKKLAVAAIAVALTFPLGLTKIQLNNTVNPVSTSLKLAYLFSYAVIDVGPHINHLQLQTQAFDKFFSLPWSSKLWIVTLMAGHALSDSADIWNAEGFWYYWVFPALAIEFYLSNVEAVAHQKPNIPELNWTSIAKFMILSFGAISMALFNWHNTFKDSDTSIDSSKIIFILLQTINAFFVTFEAWNHDTESHHHDDAVDLSQYSPLQNLEAQEEAPSVVKNDAEVAHTAAIPGQNSAASAAFFSTQEQRASNKTQTELPSNQGNSTQPSLLFDPNIKKKRMVHAHTATCGHTK